MPARSEDNVKGQNDAGHGEQTNALEIRGKLDDFSAPRFVTREDILGANSKWEGSFWVHLGVSVDERLEQVKERFPGQYRMSESG